MASFMAEQKIQKGITLVGFMIILGILSLVVSFVVPQQIWARRSSSVDQTGVVQANKE